MKTCYVNIYGNIFAENGSVYNIFSFHNHFVEDVKKSMSINAFTHIKFDNYMRDGICMESNIQYANAKNCEVIAHNAFDNAKKLCYIDISNAKIIGNYAFRDCSSLKAIRIPKTLKGFGMQPFEGCNLDLVYIPKEMDWDTIHKLFEDAEVKMFYRY